MFQIFKCPSVKWLSMKYNYLDRIPPDIGRMTNLEYLALTNNKLQNKSIPYTLIFCTRLKVLVEPFLCKTRKQHKSGLIQLLNI